MPWWSWLLITVGLIGAAALTVGREQLRYALRVTRALATDERLPRPLRLGLKAALVIKAVPVPDFGIDELVLLLIGVLLVTVYRPTLRAILAESRTGRPRP